LLAPARAGSFFGAKASSEAAAQGRLATLPRRSGRPTRRAALGPSRDVPPLAAKGDLPDPHVADSASARRVRGHLRRAPASKATSRGLLADLGRLPQLALWLLGNWQLSLFPPAVVSRSGRAGQSRPTIDLARRRCASVPQPPSSDAARVAPVQRQSASIRPRRTGLNIDRAIAVKSDDASGDQQPSILETHLPPDPPLPRPRPRILRNRRRPPTAGCRLRLSHCVDSRIAI
jgi:hypothetical protein